MSTHFLDLFSWQPLFPFLFPHHIWTNASTSSKGEKLFWNKLLLSLAGCSMTCPVFQQVKENLTQTIELWALSPIFKLWLSKVLGKQLSGQFFRRGCGTGQILTCWQKSVNYHPVHRPSGTCFTPSHSLSDQKEQCWLKWSRRCLEHTAALWQSPDSLWVGQLKARTGSDSGPFVLQMVKHLLVLEQRHWLGKPLRYQAHLPCIKNVWLSHAHLSFSYMQEMENIKT